MIPLALVLAAAAAVSYAAARFVEALRSLEDPDDLASDEFVSEALGVVNTPRKDDLAAKRARR